MDASIRRANETIKSRNEPTIYSTSVKETGFLKATDILVLTDSKIYIFKSNGSKIKNVLPIYEMMGVKIDNSGKTESKNDHTIISLIFPKMNYTFETSLKMDSPQLLHHLYDIIQHVMSLNEQRKILIDNFRVSQQRHNGTGALYRLSNICVNPIKENFLALESILIYGQPYVSTSIFQDQKNFIPEFIKVLPLCPRIKSLSFPIIDNRSSSPSLQKDKNSGLNHRNSSEINNFQLLTHLARNEFYLKHISVQGEASDEFFDFLNALKENRDSRLFGLSFVNSEFNEDHLDSLEDMISQTEMKSIEFHRAIQPSTMPYFYKAFLSTKLFESVYCLNLSGTSNLDLSKLLPRLSKIKMLCLANCGIDVKDVLFSISYLTNLRVLDLSFNRCSEPIDLNEFYELNVDMPEYFNNLMVNNISFSSRCTIPFLEFIFSKFQNGLKLSIASITTANDEWNSIFSYLHHCEFRSLVSLVWDNNPIHPKFFTFLLKNPFFDSLSLNYCIKSAAAGDSLISLALFVESTQSLSKLSLRGNSKHYIGNNLNTLLKMVQSSTSLQFLDLTYTKCGDNGIKQINSFLSSWSPLKKLAIDGTHPTNPESFIELLHTAAKLKDHLCLSFPHNDVELLVKKKLISKDEAVNLRKLFLIDEKQHSFFLQPFRVFRYYFIDDFPNYLKKAQIDEIHTKRPLITELPPLSPKSTPANPYPASQLQSPAGKPGQSPFPRNSPLNSPKRKVTPRSSEITPLDFTNSPRRAVIPKKKSPKRPSSPKSPRSSPLKPSSQTERLPSPIEKPKKPEQVIVMRATSPKGAISPRTLKANPFGESPKRSRGVEIDQLQDSEENSGRSPARKHIHKSPSKKRPTSNKRSPKNKDELNESSEDNSKDDHYEYKRITRPPPPLIFGSDSEETKPKGKTSPKKKTSPKRKINSPASNKEIFNEHENQHHDERGNGNEKISTPKKPRSPKEKSPHQRGSGSNTPKRTKRQNSPTGSPKKKSPIRNKNKNAESESDSQENMEVPVNYEKPKWEFPKLNETHDSNTFWKDFRDNFMADQLVNV
ncbi:hypothetical protein TRFO_35863 [Tritrichomonas foetus]|uniref:Leucine Rich Repeat family protein n=1 Tax=Tritrichomonas foetus TaxID=1144522 RepID=A0A1J4JJX2_9EUKA|nr:hypothetical protein TRFO_35863 [Tritrichomonas foetus]|eukprot:OHS97853.1 hypothetical protein TRFO_35863 [Tritrichomonas foetus]